MELTLWRCVLYLCGIVAVSAVKANPKVKCSADVMRIEVPLDESVERVYLEHLKDYPDPQCRPQINKFENVAVLELSLKDVYQCGITRVTNQLTGKQIFYHTIVIEEMQRKMQLHVKCVLGTPQQRIRKRNVLPAGFQEPEDLEITTSLTERAPEPILGVGVRQNGSLVTGELNVSPGTPLQMEIYLDKGSAPIYGLLVTHMQVTDTKTQEETIIFNGCSVDPYLFENFNTIDGDFLAAKFRAFKFPESTYVLFKGTVNVCLDKCRGIECSNGQIGYGRRRRAIPTMPADPNKIFEITISSFIKVKYDDESENLEHLFKNSSTKVFSNGKGYAEERSRGDDIDRLSIKTLEEKQLNNLSDGKISEEIKYTAVEAEQSGSGRTSAAVSSIITLFALLRFLP